MVGGIRHRHRHRRRSAGHDGADIPVSRGRRRSTGPDLRRGARRNHYAAESPVRRHGRLGAGNNVTAAVIAGETVTLTLTTAVTSGQTVTVTYNRPTNAARRIKDLAGNDAVSFSNEAVTNSTAAPAASDGDAGALAWSAEFGTATGTAAVAAGDAGTMEWSARFGTAAGITVPPGSMPFDGDAGTLEWSASFGTATGAAGTPADGDAGEMAWSAAFGTATGVAGVTTPFDGDAGTLAWSAAFGTATGRARRGGALDTPQVLIGAGSDEIASESYTVQSAKPKLARKIGRLFGGRDVIARHADPVWTIEFRMGPLTQAEAALLRTWVGREDVRVEFRDDDRPPNEWPNAEIWINSEIEATLVDAVPRFVNKDITRGDLWRCTIEFRESQVT